MSVRNCATTRHTFAAMSWSDDIAIETKAKATAVTNDAVAMVFSSMRLRTAINMTNRVRYVMFKGDHLRSRLNPTLHHQP